MHAALLCLCKEEERTRTGTQTRSPPPKLSPMATSLHPSPRKQPGGRGPLRCHGNRKCRAALAPPKSTRGKGYRPQKMADGEAAPAQQEGEMSAAGPVVRKERQHRGGGRPPSARDLQVSGRGGASRILSGAERCLGGGREGAGRRAGLLVGPYPLGPGL